MSSAVISTSAALRRPFIFDAEPVPEVCSISDLQRLHAEDDSQALTNQSLISHLQSAIGNRKSAIGNPLTPASHLEIRPAPKMASSGISALDTLSGGLPRGCLTEICGPASSGRTTVLLAALAAATRRGEYCVLIDASNALDPHSAAAAGVELARFLWVRCGDTCLQKSHAQGKSSQAAFKFAQVTSRKDENRLEQLLRATDMLLESGGFGLIALDLCDLPLQTSRRIPLTTWFRYRRAVEHTPTVLLALEQHPIAGSCSSLLLKLGSTGNKLDEAASQASLLPVRNPGEPNAYRKCIPGKALKRTQPDSSREAAAWESPARQCRVAIEIWNESCRDDINPDSHDRLQISYLAHTQLLTKLEIRAEVERTRLERKPSRSTSIAFASKTAWAG